MTTFDRPTCRVFPHRLGDGPANMAIDEAMLELAAEGPGSFALRTYGWTEPTLSLGYFQPFAAAEDVPRWRDVPVVRRSTGGGAILHHHEITYAVVVPKGHPLSRTSARLYQAVHEAIAGALVARNVPARRRGTRGPADAAARPFLCFLDADPEDVVVGGSKVVGSAQRRRSGSVVQHGSLLLARSPFADELPGIENLSAGGGGGRDWAARLADAIPQALGLPARPEPFPAHMLARALDIEKAVYRNPEWTRRR